MENIKSAEFTKAMRKTHTIYMPQMLHYHNELLCAAFQYSGYHLKVVPEHHEFCNRSYSAINKDYCTCAFGIVGNILTFIEEQENNRDSIAILEPQASGACRAGNYYNLIIECLKKSGNSHIPVLSLNAHGYERHKGFRINSRMLFGAIAAVCYGDLLMTLTQQIRPYEVEKGQTEALRQQWLIQLSQGIEKGHFLTNRKKIYKRIAESFAKIQTDKSRKLIRVGITGEIYIKFSPVGNFHLEDFLYENGCEIRQGGFLNYCIYIVYSEMMNQKLSGKSKAVLAEYQGVIDFLCRIQKEIKETLESVGFQHDMSFKDMLLEKKDILSDYYNIGDGWLITGEIIDLAMQGYDKIMVVHSFGCLVSHVGGRGVIKELEHRFPKTKITSVEFDYDQSKTLRESRIMMAIS